MNNPTINTAVLSEIFLFKDITFEISDDVLMDYVHSQPDIHVKTRNMIHARLRNKAGQLTPFHSGDRFIYVRGGFRSALSGGHRSTAVPYISSLTGAIMHKMQIYRTWNQ